MRLLIVFSACHHLLSPFTLGMVGKTKRPKLPLVPPSAARPSSSLETRRFPSPSHEGFGFIGYIIS